MLEKSKKEADKNGINLEQNMQYFSQRQSEGRQKGRDRHYRCRNDRYIDSISSEKKRNFLLAGGGGHRTGENRGGGKYNAIRRKAEKYFPDARETACWSAQDCVTHDRIQFAGQ
ncbi:MAG: hypothetical protein ACI4EO_02930 [Blautia sp.]